MGNATTTRTPQAAAGLCPTDRIRGAHEHEEEKVPFPVVPSSTVPSCSGAKRICSFQLRRYLVVWSCTLGSTAQPSRGIGRKKRGRTNATAFCALSSGGAPERRRRERRFPSPLFPAFARRRQADGLILPVLCARRAARPEGLPPSDYNTPPSRSVNVSPFSPFSLFSTTIRPTPFLSLSLRRAN